MSIPKHFYSRLKKGNPDKSKALNEKRIYGDPYQLTSATEPEMGSACNDNGFQIQE
jgi:hypothetical protein